MSDESAKVVTGPEQEETGGETPTKKAFPTWVGVVGVVVAVVLLAVALSVAVLGRQWWVEEQPAGNPAYVDAVTVEERGRDQYALVSGNLPDACSEVGTINQKVDGNTIYLDIYSTKPEDMMCAQTLTPFEEEILLDTGGLDPGEYTLIVNGGDASATFTLS